MYFVSLFEMSFVLEKDLSSTVLSYETSSMRLFCVSKRRAQSEVLFRARPVSDFLKITDWRGGMSVTLEASVILYDLLPFSLSSRVNPRIFTDLSEVFLSSINSLFPSAPFGFGNTSVIWMGEGILKGLKKIKKNYIDFLF